VNKGKTQIKIRGPVLSLDLGQKRVGVAIADQLLISITRLDALYRSSWKQLLRDVDALIKRFDAKSLVIGLPLRLNGTTGAGALAAEQTAEKFARSLDIPVFLQDERLTSVEARERLLADGYRVEEIGILLDSESAAIILRDFIANEG